MVQYPTYVPLFSPFVVVLPHRSFPFRILSSIPYRTICWMEIAWHVQNHIVQSPELFFSLALSEPSQEVVFLIDYRLSSFFSSSLSFSFSSSYLLHRLALLHPRWLIDYHSSKSPFCHLVRPCLVYVLSVCLHMKTVAVDGIVPSSRSWSVRLTPSASASLLSL
ncbi:hypothetical protein BDN72DRAFT_338084 [Pluteus cervinus]|uniref:Uncharacterized protein n=1 Tax=Pluteus cervinus TaxID=181527 RepID=A0ACD3ACI3_9AGAR|nr:hypothetical protein BDN72DRAFT_338084 [Pluteus cervinus]